MHQASCSSGRSPGSCKEHFCPLSFSLISCPAPVTSEVSWLGGSVQAWLETGTNCAHLEQHVSQKPSAHYSAVGKPPRGQDSCSDTNCNFTCWHEEDPSTQQHEKGQEGTIWSLRKGRRVQGILYFMVHLHSLCTSSGPATAIAAHQLLCTIQYFCTTRWEMIPLTLPRSLWVCFFPPRRTSTRFSARAESYLSLK